VLLGAGEGGAESYSKSVVSTCIDLDLIEHSHLRSSLSRGMDS
jgi:hypothetical protein